MTGMNPTAGKAFIYWDNSNIFINAKGAAEAREGAAARKRVRIHFKAMLRLACAGRPMAKAVVAGSVPPETRAIWKRLREDGAEVEELFDRGDRFGKEQEVPDERLQLRMMTDTLLLESPGVAVLMTGDGKGREKGRGFHFALELMRRKGWRVELMAWERGCHPQMREWARRNGVFIPLDDHYKAVTYLAALHSDPSGAPPRKAERLDLSRRPKAE